MRVSFNPTVSYSKPVQKQRPYQSQVSFQAAKPKKIFSSEIFAMKDEIQKVWFDDTKFKEVLKKYAHIDINSKNFDGDTIFSKALRENDNFFTSLVWMEKRGEIEGVDWNFKDRNGNNLLMIAFQAHDGYYLHNNLPEVIALANEGKIDVNYVNERGGYSLPQFVFSECDRFTAGRLFDLKDIDVTKTTRYSSYEPIVKLAIKRGIWRDDFLELVCHPSLDITQYNVQELINYINEAPNADARWGDFYSRRKALSNYEKRDYISAIETALKVNASRKTEKYYAENGTLTLDQIIRHVNHTDDKLVINRPLNETGETIAHFLAETYVDPNDTKSVEMVKELITKMQRATCYFWQEDSLGRSPLMLALEAGNFVVAKAMMEKMRTSEFKYMDLNKCGSLPCSAVQDSTINHIPALWNIIADLEPKERKELGTLFLERIKTRW